MHESPLTGITKHQLELHNMYMYICTCNIMCIVYIHVDCRAVRTRGLGGQLPPHLAN